MKQVILEQPGRLVLADGPPPGPPGPDEALVRVRSVGVCGTDFHAFKGDQPFFTYPRILGHELSAELIAAPNAVDVGLKTGDRCAVEPYLECGRCVACRRGRTNCCAKLEVLGIHVDGGMREIIKVPLRKLHRSESLSFEQLALVETLSIGAHAVGRAGLEPGETALVVGTGPIGLAVIQSAQPLGVRLLATDVNEARLEFCRRQMGVEHTFATGASAEEALRDATRGEMPTVVFEATGNPASMERSFGTTCHGAGRRLSRTDARKQIGGAELRRQLEDAGIVVRCPSNRGLAEEAPFAYKDVERVVAVVERAGLAARVAQLRPIGVVKG